MSKNSKMLSNASPAWDDDHGSSNPSRRVGAYSLSLSTRMLLFFALLASSANAFMTHRQHFAIGASIGHRWSFMSLSSSRDRQETYKTPELTQKDFVSDDPAERRLLPLLQKICDCEIPSVADSGPRLLNSLHIFKPVGSRWVNDAMKCWRQHPDPSVRLRNVEELFHTMFDLCDEYPSLYPDRYTYALVVGARVHFAVVTKDIGSMQRAEQYLSDMWTRWEESQASGTKPHRQHPGLFLYEGVFQGWMRFAITKRSVGTQAYKKALSLLKEMKELCQDGFHEYKPGVWFQEEPGRIPFHLNKCGMNSLPTLEEIVRELEASYDGELQPNQLKLFASSRRELIRRYMKNMRFDTETTISKVLPLLNEWWETCRHAEDPFTRLNTIYMNKFITAASRSKIRDAYPRSQALLQEMWRMYHETGDDSIKPNSITYSVLVGSLSNSNMKNAGEKAGELLQEMWDIYNRDKIKNKAMKPNVVTYGNMVQVWVKGERDHAGDGAERLLQEMWDRYNAGDEDMKPTNGIYNQVISTLGSLGDEEGVNRAKTLVQDMWDLYNHDTIKNEVLKPSAVTYSNMLQVFVKSNDKNIGEEAERMLREMWDRYNDGDEDMKPSIIHYSQVISAVGNASSGEGANRAKALLQEMWDLYRRDETKNNALKPSAATYYCVMQAWSKTNEENAVGEMEELLQFMSNQRDKDLKPRGVHRDLVLAAKHRDSNQVKK